MDMVHESKGRATVSSHACFTRPRQPTIANSMPPSMPLENALAGRSWHKHWTRSNPPEKQTSPENFLTGRDSPVSAAWSHCSCGVGADKVRYASQQIEERAGHLPVSTARPHCTGEGGSDSRGARHASCNCRPTAGFGSSSTTTRSSATPHGGATSVQLRAAIACLQGGLVLGPPAAALLSQDLDVGGHDVTQANDHNVACKWCRREESATAAVQAQS